MVEGELLKTIAGIIVVVITWKMYFGFVKGSKR